MTDGLLRRFALWFDELTKPDDEIEDVDCAYLRDGRQYKHITTQMRGEKPDTARCDLCGRVFKLQKMPKAISHVATHDSQGSADVDPFELEPKTVEWDYSHMIEHGQEGVSTESENQDGEQAKAE